MIIMKILRYQKRSVSTGERGIVSRETDALIVMLDFRERKLKSHHKNPPQKHGQHHAKMETTVSGKKKERAGTITGEWGYRSRQ